MGLLVWAENGHSNVNKTTDTGDHITREMVRQNYNHPPVGVWGLGNEQAADTAVRVEAGFGYHSDETSW